MLHIRMSVSIIDACQLLQQCLRQYCPLGSLQRPCRAIQVRGCVLRCSGPFVLDLGDMLYAPNCFRDGQERHIMVAWLQEHASRQASFDYSGCITLPRVLTLSGAPPLHRQSAA